MRSAALYTAQKAADTAISSVAALVVGLVLAMAGVGVATHEPQRALDVPADVAHWLSVTGAAAEKYVQP